MAQFLVLWFVVSFVASLLVGRLLADAELAPPAHPHNR